MSARARRVPVQHPFFERLANAPVDDEPVTEEDLRAIEQGREDMRRGRLVSHEQVRRELLGKGTRKKRRAARS